MTPIYLRNDSAMSRVRWSVWADRLEREGTGLVGWSREFAVYFEEIVALVRYHRPVRGYLGWLFLAGILLLIGIPVCFQEMVVGAIFTALGLFVLVMSISAGVKRRPFLIVVTETGQEHEIRMDRPMFRAGTRHEFFVALFRGLNLKAPADAGW